MFFDWACDSCLEILNVLKAKSVSSTVAVDRYINGSNLEKFYIIFRFYVSLIRIENKVKFCSYFLKIDLKQYKCR
jgi:hypothetical protein